MSRRIIKKNKISKLLKNYIENHKREYLILTILFFIGIIIGILLINNETELQHEETNKCLNNIVDIARDKTKINSINLMKKSILKNVSLTLALWIGASTIIGIFIIYGSTVIIGLAIGYTISSIISYFGLINGLVIIFSLLIMHNIIFIPTLFAICISGLKLYKSIMKSKSREDIKNKLIIHTVICFFMLTLMVLSSFVEVYISNNLFLWSIKYLSI